MRIVSFRQILRSSFYTQPPTTLAHFPSSLLFFLKVHSLCAFLALLSLFSASMNLDELDYLLIKARQRTR
jgi:hypothetical protein